MTCVGTSARLWAYEYDADYVTEFWPLGDGLSDKTEYVDYSTHGREILEMLEHIKRNPIPDKNIFQNPPWPRPQNATLPPGWHDDEVQLIHSTSTQPAHDYQAPDRPDLQMSGYTSVAQSQHMDLVLDATQCLEAVVERFDGDTYQCIRLTDGGYFHVPAGEWLECLVGISGQLRPCYSWTTQSGRQYYTFSLESERK